VTLLRRSDHITYVLASQHCASMRASSIRSLCWHIKFFMGLYHISWIHSSVCPIYWVGVVSAHPALSGHATIQTVYYWQQNLQGCCCSDMYNLPKDIILPLTVHIFRKRMKTHLFCQSNPNIVSSFSWYQFTNLDGWLIWCANQESSLKHGCHYPEKPGIVAGFQKCVSQG